MTNSTPCAAMRFGNVCSSLSCLKSDLCIRPEMIAPYIPPEDIDAQIIDECRRIGALIVEFFNMPSQTPELHGWYGEEKHMVPALPDQLYRFYTRWPGQFMHGGVEKMLEAELLWTDRTADEIAADYNPESVWEGNIDPAPDAPTRLSQWFDNNLTTPTPYPAGAGISKRRRWSVIATLYNAWVLAVTHSAYEGDGYFQHFDDDGNVIV